MAKIQVGLLPRKRKVDMMDGKQTLLEIACERARQREASSVAFELKELFSKKEWEKLDRGVRRDLGRDFSYVVGKGNIENLRHDGENQFHHNMYLKS